MTCPSREHLSEKCAKVKRVLQKKVHKVEHVAQCNASLTKNMKERKLCQFQKPPYKKKKSPGKAYHSGKDAKVSGMSDKMCDDGKLKKKKHA